MRQFTALCMCVLCIGAMLAEDVPTKPQVRKVDFDLLEKKGDCGICLAITKNSILICDTGKAPKTYFFHDRLAAGEVQKKAGESKSYRVSDIEVGDIVSVGVVTENKQVFCVDLGIHERPGGLIPPSQVVDKKRPWYQWQNAQIAFRDKGIPIPEHLKPQTPPPLPKVEELSKLPPEQHQGDHHRHYGYKVKLPWLLRCPERKLDFDAAERTIVSGQVKELTLWGVTVESPGAKPIYYYFHDRLHDKEVQKKASPAFSYSKTDIKIGDLVELGIVHVDYSDPCVDISIRERPGGLVPAPQIVDKKRPYHEVRNAQIAFRDKGIPIPEHLIVK